MTSTLSESPFDIIFAGGKIEKIANSRPLTWRPRWNYCMYYRRTSRSNWPVSENTSKLIDVMKAIETSCCSQIIEDGPETRDKPIHTQPGRFFSNLRNPDLGIFQYHQGRPSKALSERSPIVSTGRCLGGGSNVNCKCLIILIYLLGWDDLRFQLCYILEPPHPTMMTGKICTRIQVGVPNIWYLSCKRLYRQWSWIISRQLT